MKDRYCSVPQTSLDQERQRGIYTTFQWQGVSKYKTLLIEPLLKEQRVNMSVPLEKEQLQDVVVGRS